MDGGWHAKDIDMEPDLRAVEFLHGAVETVLPE
jgi:hypothetical protein